MATSVEKSERKKDSIIKNVLLTLKNTLINFQLAESSITWTPLKQLSNEDIVKNPKKLKIKEQCVPYSEVVSVHLVEDGSGFTLTIIDKQPKCIWRRESYNFQSHPLSNCEELVKTIQEKVYNVPTRPKHLLVFVNPISGGKKGTTIQKKYTIPMFKEAQVNVEYIITTHSGHIKEYLVKNDCSQYDGVVVVGGDGTITEAATGLILATCEKNAITDLDTNHHITIPTCPIKLGIIPAGTGQGMVNFATNTYDVETSVLHIIKGCTQSVNSVVAYNDNKLLTFGVMLGAVGLFADSIKYSEANRWMGRLRYIYILKALAIHRAVKAEISFIKKDASPSEQMEGAGDASSQENKGTAEYLWTKHSCSSFRSAGFFLFDLQKQCYADGIPLAVQGDEYGRIKHLKAMKSLFDSINKKEEENSTDSKQETSSHSESSQSSQKMHGDTQEVIITKAIKFNYLQTPEEMKALSLTAKREVINIDGDPFVLTHPEVEIRFHPNVIDFYGCGDVYRKGIIEGASAQ